MTTKHPITPPNELVQQWHLEWWQLKVKHVGINEYIAARASCWGADQQLRLDAKHINQAWQEGADHELEACCERLSELAGPTLAADLRLARRPKPPSLAEQALDAQERMWIGGTTHADWELIRAALERLQELEKGNE